MFKSRIDRMLCGVCGGIAESLGISSIIVRALAIFLAIIFPITVVIYLILCILANDKPY